MSTNEASGYAVPSVALAEALDLRVMPVSLDWCDPHGRKASMTFAAPPGFLEWGQLLYFREDLMRDYCDQHNYALVWIVVGERDVWFADALGDRPEWLERAYSESTNAWRRVVSLDDMGRDGGHP